MEELIQPLLHRPLLKIRRESNKKQRI